MDAEAIVEQPELHRFIIESLIWYGRRPSSLRGEYETSRTDSQTRLPATLTAMFRSLVSSTGRLSTALNVSRQAGLAQLNVAQRTYAGWSPASTTYKKPASPSASPSTSSSSSKPGYSSAARTTSPPPIEEAAAEFDTAPVSSAASQAPLIKVSEGGSAEENGQDWASSFFGLSTTPFSKEAAEVLMRPVKPEDIECKPGTSIYADNGHTQEMFAH